MRANKPGTTAAGSTSAGIFGVLLLTLLWFLPAGSVHAAQRALQGHVPAAVASLQPQGRLAPATRLELSIALSLHNQDKLTRLLQQLYDPASTNFHRYLTPQQFTEQFGPTVQEYSAVQDFARSNGLMVRLCMKSLRQMISLRA